MQETIGWNSFASDASMFKTLKTYQAKGYKIITVIPLRYCDSNYLTDAIIVIEK